MSAPRTQKITSVAILVAWSAMRSRAREIKIEFNACIVYSGCCWITSYQICMSNAIHAVDLVIHLKYRIGHLRIGIQQRLDRRADHATGKLTHSAEIHRQVDFRHLDHVLGANGDAHRLIANALQVAIDLDDRQDEAQIDRHWLLLGEQLISHLIQIALRGVDGRLVLPHILAELQIAPQIRFDGRLNRLLRQARPWPEACPSIRPIAAESGCVAIFRSPS